MRGFFIGLIGHARSAPRAQFSRCRIPHLFGASGDGRRQKGLERKKCPRVGNFGSEPARSQFAQPAAAVLRAAGMSARGTHMHKPLMICREPIKSRRPFGRIQQSRGASWCGRSGLAWGRLRPQSSSRPRRPALRNIPTAAQAGRAVRRRRRDRRRRPRRVRSGFACGRPDYRHRQPARCRRHHRVGPGSECFRRRLHGDHGRPFRLTGGQRHPLSPAEISPAADLAPIAIFGTTGAVLLTNNTLPVKTAQDLVALAKSRPGELTFASTGVGTPGHLNGELFSRWPASRRCMCPIALSDRQ